MKTTFVDMGKLKASCREEGIRIGVEKGVVHTIAQMIQGGLSKKDIMKLPVCSEEIYQKAYTQAHS